MSSLITPAGLTAYRLVKTIHAQNAFDGEGARLYGGRWNSPGLPVVYTSQARSLALLEVLVHVDASLPLPSFCFCQIKFSETEFERLPPDAFNRRDDIAHTRSLGDAWQRARRRPVLAVPSVIVPEETNYLLNPEHPRFADLTRDPAIVFHLDQRLVPRVTAYPKARARPQP